MDLAERIDANRWQLSSRIEETLTALGERGDILRTLHKALRGEQRDCAVPDESATASIIGRIIAKGLADEMNDRSYLVLDGVDGRAHYVRLPTGIDLTEFPTGGIAEVKPTGQARAVDRTIHRLTRDGVYKTAEHLEELARAAVEDPQAAVDVYVRRLESLRRGGVVQRIADGVWQIPPDLQALAQGHDATRTAGVSVNLHSHLPIDRQVRTVGATWLDRQLVRDGNDMAAQGFGAQARDAMQRRVDFLAEQGLAERCGSHVVLARNLLGTLRDRELSEVSKALQGRTGLAYRPSRDGERITGVYRRSIQLASERFAMLDDGRAFSLVPWRAVIEPRIGKPMTAVVRGGAVTWTFGRQQGLSA
jgi:hypothetical protein